MATEIVTQSQTTPEWSNIEYSWKLDKPWELRALASDGALEGENGDMLASPRFGDQRRGVWQLKLYPYGESSAEDKGQISVFLSLDTAYKPSAYALFSCVLLDAQGSQYQKPLYARQKFSSTKTSWGWTNFVAGDNADLLETITRTSFILKCTIDVFIGAKVVSQTTTTPQTFLLDDIRRYFRSLCSCDLKLICQSVVLDTQRTLLAARSSWFRAVLFGETSASKPCTQRMQLKDDTPPKECSPPHTDKPDEQQDRIERDEKGRVISIEICRRDVTPYALKQMLQFMLYDTCNALECPPTNLSSLLNVFHTSWVFDVTSLYMACLNVLMRCVDGQASALRIMTVARDTGCTELQKQCQRYLDECIPEFSDEERLRLILPLCTESIQQEAPPQTNVR